MATRVKKKTYGIFQGTERERLEVHSKLGGILIRPVRHLVGGFRLEAGHPVVPMLCPAPKPNGTMDGGPQGERQKGSHTTLFPEVVKENPFLSFFLYRFMVG